jgi:cell division protease FtsH
MPGESKSPPGKKSGDAKTPPKRPRNLLGVSLVSAMLLLLVWMFSRAPLLGEVEKSPGEFWQDLLSGRIRTVVMEGGTQLHGELAPDGEDAPRRFKVSFPENYLVEKFDFIQERANLDIVDLSGQDFKARLESGRLELLEATLFRLSDGTRLEVRYLDDNGSLTTARVTPDIEGTGQLNGIYAAIIERGHAVGIQSLRNPEAFRYKEPNTFLAQLVFTFGPWVLIIALFWFFIFRQVRTPSGTGGVLSFGRSRAKLYNKETSKVTFEDVAGIDEAKDEVQEIVEFLKNPGKFQRIGARIPRGVLLVGPPGTGKTLLAKAIAGEADVPFFSICGSDFVEMFVGVGASRVRDLFKQAKENSPCIVFLDEIDAVGRRRGTGLGGGHDEREQTLNAILVEMDGFDTDQGIILIAATNRPDVLDPALLRPGRFDRQITIEPPDIVGREAILKVHARKVKVHPSVDMQVIARGTPTFSGAELEALINEAALLAVLHGEQMIRHEHLEEARDKVKWGRQRKSRAMDPADQLITAYHEAGHALVAAMLAEVEPLHKVTIIPRGLALGATMQLPEKDVYHFSKRKMMGNLKVLYAGRIAEEIFCDDITAGASNDIERATELARAMVCEWGMSDNIGPIHYGDSKETFFLGREVTRTLTHSDTLTLEIDREVKRLLDECYQESRRLIEDHRNEVDQIAKALVEFEVLSRPEVEGILAGRTIEDLGELRRKERAAQEEMTRRLRGAHDESVKGGTPDAIATEEEGDMGVEGKFAY